MTARRHGRYRYGISRPRTTKEATMTANKTNQSEPDLGTKFSVFFAAFWPMTLLLGVADHWLIPGYDLRAVSIAAGALAGWVAVMAYGARQRKAAGQGDQETGSEDAEWVAVGQRLGRG